jgi:DNA-binding XRE family transcriptional regulator
MSKDIEKRIAALERVLKPPKNTREDEPFADRLLSLRKMRGLTMDALCSDTGISKGFYCDLEKGRREPGAGTLYKLARRLGVTMDYLWTGLL